MWLSDIPKRTIFVKTWFINLAVFLLLVQSGCLLKCFAINVMFWPGYFKDKLRYDSSSYELLAIFSK